MYRRILTPVDGSEASTRALDEAIKLAKEFQARLRLVYVDTVEAMAREIIDVAVARVKNAGLEAESGLLVKLGTEQVPDAILEEAVRWSADLIVMGTHGRRGVAHMFLGSVAEGLIRIAPMPILVVPGGKASERRKDKE